VSRSLTLAFFESAQVNNVIWPARMSILFSFIRLAHPKSPHRRAGYASAVLFTFLWLVIFVHQVQQCRFHDCTRDRTSDILQIVAAACTDVPLIVLPLWLLRHSGLARTRRVLVYIVFFSSTVTTALVIFHSVADMGALSLARIVAAYLVTSISLLICNMFVIITCVARLLGLRDREDADVGDRSEVLTSAIEVSQILPVASKADSTLLPHFTRSTIERRDTDDDDKSAELHSTGPDTTDSEEEV